MHSGIEPVFKPRGSPGILRRGSYAKGAEAEAPCLFLQRTAQAVHGHKAAKDS